MIKDKMLDKDQLQEDEYVFPYHYLSLVIPHRHIIYLNKVKRIKKRLKDVSKDNIADIGCGDAFLFYSIKEGRKDLCGYDISEQAIRFAKAFNPNVEFIEHDITKTPLPKKYSVIILEDIIEHLPVRDLNKAIKNIESSLKLGGKIILTTPTLNMAVEEKHYQHFDLDKIKGYFNNFEVLSCDYLDKPSKKYMIYLWLCWITYPFELIKKPYLYRKFLELATKASNAEANENNGRELLVVLRYQ